MGLILYQPGEEMGLIYIHQLIKGGQPARERQRGGAYTKHKIESSKTTSTWKSHPFLEGFMPLGLVLSPNLVGPSVSILLIYGKDEQQLNFSLAKW